jgi:hypothetical protein
MASGNSHDLVYGYQGTSTGVLRLEFGSYRGDYRVRAGLLDDAGVWASTEWVVIRDQLHYIELDWRAAASPETHDGGLTLWVDGALAEALTGSDNDTCRLDQVAFGPLNGLDNDTRGTYYFDAFESRSRTDIGPEPGVPEPPPPPVPPDALFADGFESGALAAWSDAATDSGDLSVTSEAALSGSYGLQAVVNDTTPIYVVDWTPFHETRYRARFRFDPNGITMAHGDTHKLLVASGYKLNTVWLEFRYANEQYQVNLLSLLDYGGGSATVWVPISDAPHLLEIDWQAATAPGANDGHLTLWIDGVVRTSYTGLDNDTRRVELVSLGAAHGLDSDTSGVYYFDAYESRRESSPTTGLCRWGNIGGLGQPGGRNARPGRIGFAGPVH